MLLVIINVFNLLSMNNIPYLCSTKATKKQQKSNNKATIKKKQHNYNLLK